MSPSDFKRKLSALLREQPELTHEGEAIDDLVEILAWMVVVPQEKHVSALLLPAAVFLMQVKAIARNDTHAGPPLEEALAQALKLEYSAKRTLSEEESLAVDETVRAVLAKVAEFGYSLARTKELTLEDAEEIEKGAAS